MRRDRVPGTLDAAPFVHGTSGPELAGPDFAARTAGLGAVVARLARAGAFAPRGELYPVVAAFGAAPLLQVDRAAVPYFGVRPFGVHLCAYVRRAGELFAWVAIRARDKTFPGMWDNTVAGGQPIGLSLRANLVKECGEEAALPADLARRAVEVATLTYVREDDTGLKPDTLFCYDLEVPPDCTPRPHDGEVEEFRLVRAAELAIAVRDTACCKPNCALVWIDFLLRHGVLDAEVAPAERARLAAALRAPLPA